MAPPPAPPAEGGGSEVGLARELKPPAQSLPFLLRSPSHHAAAPPSPSSPVSATSPQVLRVLLDRLKNEVTRQAAVKALATIARSPLNIDLSPVLAPALAELTGFLRKANRQLRQAALNALDAIVCKDGSRVEPAVLQSGAAWRLLWESR